MIFPKSNQIYDNLNTSFTNFNELLTDLKTNQITGYLQVSFWDYDGVLFLDSGTIINAVEESENTRTIGEKAIKNIQAKVKDKDGTLSVFGLTPDLVLLLSGALEGTIIHEKLSSDFADLEKLVKKLETDSHTGYIEIKLNNNDHAILFLQNGELTESVLAQPTKTVSGDGTHQQIYHLVREKGAELNVYRSGFSVNNAEITTGENSIRIIEMWNGFINTISKFFPDDNFDQSLRKVLISHADNYPFLDPFVGELQFNENKLVFDGYLPARFSKGLGMALTDLISEAADPNLKIQLEALVDLHKETIEKYELDDVVNNMLAMEKK